jgi:hypothetical protein
MCTSIIKPGMSQRIEQSICRGVNVTDAHKAPALIPLAFFAAYCPLPPHPVDRVAPVGCSASSPAVVCSCSVGLARSCTVMVCPSGSCTVPLLCGSPDGWKGYMYMWNLLADPTASASTSSRNCCCALAEHLHGGAAHACWA